MPFTGTDEIHMRAPTCKYADSKSGFNDMVGIEIRYRQGNLAVFFYFGWRRHSRIVSLPHGESVRRHSPSFPWKEVPRRGGGWLSPKYEREYEESGLSYRHPERSRGIFYVVAVLCTYEVMIKSPRCFGCSSSDALRLTVVQGRFLAALEMTRGGRTVIRGRAFSLLAFPTFSAKRSHSLRKEHLRNHHFPPILSAFSHRFAPRGSSMDFFKNKRVSPHFLQI